jgi:Tfp pilus assembly protein FimT
MFSRRRQSSGYTLVELLIIVALMAILATLTIPAFESSLYDQLNAAASIVSADLSYARSLAVSNNSHYRITFDTDENKYVLRHSGANSSLNILPENPFRPQDDLSSEQTTDLDELPQVGATVRLAAVYHSPASPQTATRLEFGPYGETSRATATVIWLSAGTESIERFISLTVDPITGIVDIGEMTEVTPPTLDGAE